MCVIAEIEKNNPLAVLHAHRLYDAYSSWLTDDDNEYPLWEDLTERERKAWLMALHGISKQEFNILTNQRDIKK